MNNEEPQTTEQLNVEQLTQNTARFTTTAAGCGLSPAPLLESRQVGRHPRVLLVRANAARAEATEFDW